MNKTHVMLLVGLPLCAGLLCSCASNSINDSPPVQTAQNSETSQTVQEPWGTKTIFKDAAGYIVRVEKRGPDNHYLPGACISQFSYDNGLRIAKQNLNAQGSLVCNSNGFAITKYAYQFNPGKQPIVEERFFDPNNQPVVTKSGFALMTCTGTPDGRIYTAHFSDFMNNPAPSVWYGVSNVVDVQYYYLQGVTPIVCGVFCGRDGNIIDRKQLKGLTSQVVVEADDDSSYDVPVYIHAGGSGHDHDGGFHGGHH